jgi:hypothetical protein
MNKMVEIDGKMFELKPIKANRKTIKSNIGLAYWTKQKGYKVLKDNLSYTAKYNGKTYPAKEISILDGNTNQPKTLLIKSTKGGNVWTSKNF